MGSQVMQAATGSWKRQKADSPLKLEELEPCFHLDFRLLTSKTESVSDVLSHESVLICFSSHRKLIQSPHCAPATPPSLFTEHSKHSAASQLWASCFCSMGCNDPGCMFYSFSSPLALYSNCMQTLSGWSSITLILFKPASPLLFYVVWH